MMKRSPKKYSDIRHAKSAFRRGKNITELLREQLGVSENTPEIIETAYDLQAGSRVIYTKNNFENVSSYAKEISDIVSVHVSGSDTLLDVGTGELTTLSLLPNNSRTVPRRLLACDISWSRLWKGLPFAREHMGAYFDRLVPFVADMAEVPLPAKSINVTMSCHSLEPNGGREAELLSELFRVTKDMLLLFEPCYEINSEEGKRRMEALGYIRNLDGAISALGGDLLDKIRLENVNPINPTVCFVVRPPKDDATTAADQGGDTFSVPGTSLGLARFENIYFSQDTGLCFPVIRGIPILRSDAAVLATALMDPA